MARPTYLDVDHGQQSWDADIQTNIDIYRDQSIPVPEYATTAGLPAANLNDRCIAAVTNPPSLWFSNGSAWIEMPSVGVATTTDPGDHIPGGSRWLYTSTGVVSPVSEIQYARIWLQAGVTISNMKYWQHLGGGAGVNVNLGVYDQATPLSISGVPQNKVAETGTVLTSAGDDNSFKTIALLSPYLVPTTGYYWVAFMNDAAGLQVALSPSYPQDFLPVRREAGATTVLPAAASGLTNPGGAAAFSAAVE